MIAATGIPEMIEISVGKHFRENREKSIMVLGDGVSGPLGSNGGANDAFC